MENTSFTFMITGEQYQELKKIAETERRTLASAMRNILDDYFFQAQKTTHIERQKPHGD